MTKNTRIQKMLDKFNSMPGVEQKSFLNLVLKGEPQMSKSKKCFNEIAETINRYELTHKDMEEVIQMLQHGFQHSIDAAIVVLEEHREEE